MLPAASTLLFSAFASLAQIHAGEPPLAQNNSSELQSARLTKSPDIGAYYRMVSRVANMPNNDRATSLAERHGLALLNVLWEDTGRWEGSSVGPNISDVTIEVEVKRSNGRSSTALMPVLRHPNFTDKTGDVSIDKIRIPVGNHRDGGELKTVSLRDFLAEPTAYLSNPEKGTIKGGSLLAKRDSHVLMSAQATFLPIPAQGSATFWPVIFNYQSTVKNPAVLTILVTRQGTSVTIVDNQRDSLGQGSWGQRLFFNDEGQRAPLSAERLSHVKATGFTANGEAAETLGDDANLLMLIQVPLKTRPEAMKLQMADDYGAFSGIGSAAMAESAPAASRQGASSVEAAVLGHGPKLGPFVELDGLRIRRDPRFPIRVTVQFYQATSNSVLAASDVKSLAKQMKRVYDDADYVGSLVVPSAEDRQRPTAFAGAHDRPSSIVCEDFSGLVQADMCESNVAE